MCCHHMRHINVVYAAATVEAEDKYLLVYIPNLKTGRKKLEGKKKERKRKIGPSIVFPLLERRGQRRTAIDKTCARCPARSI